MSRRHARVARGAAAAFATTLLAAAAHTLGGAGAPSPLLCGVVAILATPVAVLLAGAAPSWWRTAAAVGASQVLLHAVFATIGDPGAWASVPTGHVHGPVHLDLGSAPAAGGGHGDMTLAHVAAGLVTVIVVHRGERMLRALARGIRHLLPPLPVLHPRAVPPRAPLVPAAAVRPPAPVALSDLSRRGPPRLSVRIAA